MSTPSSLTSIAASLCTGALAASCLAWSGAAPAAEPEPDSPPVLDTGAWSVRQHEGGESVELVTRNPAGAFGAICSEGSCVLFIEPTKGCDPGAVYPVMANSATSIAMVESACQMVRESRDPDGAVRTLATMAPSHALINSIAQGERIALAFPQTEGDVDVVAVETHGLREALRSAGGMAPEAMESSGPAPHPQHFPGLGTQPAAVY